jgi:hypothetical protein
MVMMMVVSGQLHGGPAFLRKSGVIGFQCGGGVRNRSEQIGIRLRACGRCPLRSDWCGLRLRTQAERSRATQQYGYLFIHECFPSRTMVHVIDKMRRSRRGSAAAYRPGHASQRARYANRTAKLAGARRCFRRAPVVTYQPAYKPGFVWPAARAANVTAIPLVRRLPGASCNLPE